VQRWPLIARVACLAVLAALLFPSDGSANGRDIHVALTATGPSPATVTIYPISDIVWFFNQDSVARTVVFAEGHCSLSIPPGGEYPSYYHCADYGHGQWPFYVGSYPYSVDGKFPGTVDVVGFYRSVSLTAQTHTIRLGRRLRLHGQLTLTNPKGGPGLCGVGNHSPVVRVLARHDRRHPFQRIAMFVLHVGGRSTSHGCNYAWQLKVRPGLRTIYIADSKLSADLWKPATSRPFRVTIQH
jgi:hypothetical protein